MIGALVSFVLCLLVHESYGQTPKPTPKPTPRPRTTTEEAINESVVVFSVLYSLTLVMVLVMFYLERKGIKPIKLAHAARESPDDFTAVQTFSGNFNINERIKAAVPPKENIVWSDVSLIIAPISHLVVTLVNFALGFLLIIATSHSDSQLNLMPLLLIVLFVGFTYVGIGLKQVVGKQHFKNIYAFTETRVLIIDYSHINCRKPYIEYIPYYDIADVRMIIERDDTGRDDVGSITFRKKSVKDGFVGKASYNSIFKSLDKGYVELLNIVNPREIEKLLLRYISYSNTERIGPEGGYQEL